MVSIKSGNGDGFAHPEANTQCSSNDNFYVGLGFGLKRLIGVPKVTDSYYGGYGGEKRSALDGKLPFGGGDLYPTIRIINVGFVF